MTHRTYLKPIVVQGPAPITPLEAAMIALGDTSSKMAHFEPRHRQALLEYVAELEAENQRLSDELNANSANYITPGNWGGYT